jgi:hypothetical protein
MLWIRRAWTLQFSLCLLQMRHHYPDYCCLGKKCDPWIFCPLHWQPFKALIPYLICDEISLFCPCQAANFSASTDFLLSFCMHKQIRRNDISNNFSLDFYSIVAVIIPMLFIFRLFFGKGIDSLDVDSTNMISAVMNLWFYICQNFNVRTWNEVSLIIDFVGESLLDVGAWMAI